MRRLWLLALAPVLLSAAPPRDVGDSVPPRDAGSSVPPRDAAGAAEFVLDCYLDQSGQLGIGQFVRHLQVYPGRGIVSIADGPRGGAAPRFVGNGRLVVLDAARLIFDFESPSSTGRTEIDRRSGAFRYADGRTVISGSCQPSSL